MKEGSEVMAQVRQYHKDTDTTYVYESESYWDTEKKQSRSRRRLIGKIDPATGEIVPCGKRGRKPKDPEKTPASSSPSTQGDVPSLSEKYAAVMQQVRDMRTEIGLKDGEISSLRKENKKLRDVVSRMRNLSEQITGISDGVLK